MNLQKLFEIQTKLDEHIVKEKGLEGQNLLDEKILALQVELGELANEWRGFKFWSEDREPRTKEIDYFTVTKDNFEYKNPLLEEYVDCLHFILSIGNEIEFKSYHLVGTIDRQDGITDMFNSVYEEISALSRSIKQRNLTNNGMKVAVINYSVVLESLLDIGEMLGFTWEQIEQAYLDKNKINHERQANGY